MPIFCSLVEFYGKDFFNRLPDEEQNTVKKFYSKNKFGFKLSDPSIVGNDNEVLKIDNLNLDSGIELNESDNNIKNNLNGLKDGDEIVKKNIGGDNGAKMRKKTKLKKAKSNYHIGKIIFFGLLAIGVGLYFGWLYALIPVALLIAFAILDHKFNFLPEPKTIFCCFRSCLNSNRKIEEKEKNPKQDENINKEEKQIEK